MIKKAGSTGEIFNPFPGLRPFRQEEAHLFFGREGQSKYVLNSLEANNFVAVIGASGSGKSSLIYCGVIPELLQKSKHKWITVASRPGTSPVKNLLKELFAAFQLEENESVQSDILESRLNFSDFVQEQLGADRSLLLVVDQFEELFRYRHTEVNQDQLKEINRFVELLYSSCTLEKARIRVVITMRSDFIGECSVFQELTDLINKSNYLIPQMTRDDFRKAITGPIQVGGASIDEKLVELLLDEVGTDTDQLPVLQHSLMRTWDYWMLQNDLSKAIAVGDYEAVGRMEKALSDHANEAFDELNEAEREICESLFKALTEKGGDNRGIRRPSSIQRISEITRSSVSEIIRIAEVFRSKGRTFLTPYQPDVLKEDTVIDISHESLMRIWDRLRLWVDEEASSVQMYQRLSEASELYMAGTGGLWRPPDLLLALSWKEKQQPTSKWAIQYNPAFERTMVFLENSDLEFRKEEENKLRLQKRRLRVTRIFSIVLGAIAVLAFGVVLYTWDLRNKAEVALDLAVKNEEEATLQKQNALDALNQADSLKIVAQLAAEDASKKKEEAEAAAIVATEQGRIARLQQRRAEENALKAQEEEEKAQENFLRAERERKTADSASREARKQQILSIAKSMAVKSLQIDKDDDADLKGLLAYQAFIFNDKYDGPAQESDIYAGLYDARKALLGNDFNVFEGHTQKISSILFTGNKNQFMSAGSDGKILVHSLDDTIRAYEVFDSLDIIIEALALGPEGKYLISASNKRGIFVYDQVNKLARPVQLMGHNGMIRDVEFGKNPEELYSIGVDKQILKWNLDEQTSEVLFTAETRFRDLAVSHNAHKLAASDDDGKIYILSLIEPGRIDTIPGNPDNQIYSLDFSNDGQYLAAGDKNGNVRLISTESLEREASLRGSTARIMGVTFSPFSHYLASSSLDGKVLMWDMSNLNNSPILMEDHNDYVFTVTFSPDENFLLSGSRSIKVGPVRPVQLTGSFCSLLRRSFTQEEWNNYVGSDIEYQETCTDYTTENQIE